VAGVQWASAAKRANAFSEMGCSDGMWIVTERGIFQKTPAT
jgi:hypothetical protein